MRVLAGLIVILSLLAMSGPAYALQSFTGRVVRVEATYMPTQIPFILSEGNTTCPAGKPIYWSSQNVENNKAIYATLIAAMTSGKKITFIVDDGDQSCRGKFLYLEDA
ncbi:hypothetical protein [Xanthomonas melonis]|uniref:Uncharacterized protein n=1 Tax=Xanthomonas melonis TaxID=56456 RepID=A0A2S7DBG3_9XANT|nr:hypothetical protein [Xanthomonas melonis]MCC4601674.1 hypothetical protein [Xanthomonas melonis]PPU71168.1 hypothetical protein XmelCFBP4644_16970 [Xanthomonas melonis]